MLELDFSPIEPNHEAMRPCVLCGAKWTRVGLKFDTGATEPQADETLTGATSTDTGVVTEVILISGAWDGTAAGYLEMKSEIGIDEDGHWGTDNENINGSVGGTSIIKVDGEGWQMINGILYPESRMIEVDGKWFCKGHYNFRHRRKKMDEQIPDISE